jgi:hypothetical protein
MSGINYLFGCRRLLKFLIFSALFLTSSISFSQTLTSSPYSRYGLGDLQGNGFAQNEAMGGAGYGWRCDTFTPSYINITNPASYSSYRITTIEFGLLSNTTQFQTSDQNFKLNNSSFGYVAVGLPIKHWWGLSFGLVPYSNVGYKIHDQKTLDTIGIVNYNYEGSGGINKAFLGSGFSLLPESYSKRTGSNLSIGVNGNFMFGTINNIRHIAYNDPNYYNLRIDEDQSIHDVSVDFGLQYRFHVKTSHLRTEKVKYDKRCAFPDKIRKDTLDFYVTCTIDSCRNKGPFGLFGQKCRVRHGNDSTRLVPAYQKVTKENDITFGIGLTFAPAMGLRGTSDFLAQTYLQPGYFEVYKDTIVNNVNQTSYAKIPMKVGVGISINNTYKWNILADYTYQQWGDFTYGGINPGLLNSTQASLGFQFQPALRGSYLKVARYRLGLRYYQTYLDLNNSQLTETGFTFGVALPVTISKEKKHTYDLNRYRNYSMINISGEVGTRGTTSNGLVKENYARIILGFTINDRWFQRYKYD